MTRLHRPYIPLKVRLAVAERQLFEAEPDKVGYAVMGRKTAGNRLRALLSYLFGIAAVELHHRPALVNRMRRKKFGGKVVYIPDANDPEHLVYLRAADHDVETRVRGLGAQRSDLAQARYLKRVARNKAELAAKATAKNNRKYNQAPERAGKAEGRLRLRSPAPGGGKGEKLTGGAPPGRRGASWPKEKRPIPSRPFPPKGSRRF